jgi:hypothetical protein
LRVVFFFGEAGAFECGEGAVFREVCDGG